MATVTGYPGSFRKMEKIELTTEEWKAEKKKEESPDGSHAGLTL